MRYSGVVTGFTFSLLMSVSGWAADVAQPDLCAVSGVNGKLHAQGGVWDAKNIGSEGQFQGVGSFSLPLGCAFGLQVDGGAATFGDVGAFGVGGHVFTRDPTSYLLGIHGTYENWNFKGPVKSVDVLTLGAEAEIYLDNISLEGWAGIQDTKASKADFFAKLTAAYYMSEDLRLAVGLRHTHGFTSGVVNGEWQMTDTPLSFTAEAQFGEHRFTSINAGLKFYFGGPQKSLIDRHRQDDPDDGLFDFIGAAAGIAGNGGGGAVCADGTMTDGMATDGAATDGACGDGVIVLPP
jgi:hypothetical protein